MFVVIKAMSTKYLKWHMSSISSIKTLVLLLHFWRENPWITDWFYFSCRVYQTFWTMVITCSTHTTHAL